MMTIEQDKRPLIDIGWMIDSRLEDVDRRATKGAMEEVHSFFNAQFPDFEWRMFDQVHELPREEPALLLEAGEEESSLRRWDFAIVVTAANLPGTYLPSALAVPARALGTAIVSTARIDPRSHREDVSADERRDLIRARLFVLCTRCLCYLAGGNRLDSVARNEIENFALAKDVRSVMKIGAPERVRLEAEFARVADLRVEEERNAEHQNAFVFNARALWRNRSPILKSLRANRSWEFPFRMGRLTTAAFSAVAILMVTAEAWEIAGQLTPPTLSFLALASISGTSIYVLRRQQLLTSRNLRTERTVVARANAVLFVVTGVFTAYALLSIASYSLSKLLFSDALIARWSQTDPSASVRSIHVALAAFTSALGILIGTLGASFEGQHYVRYIAWVDDEF